MTSRLALAIATSILLLATAAPAQASDVQGQVGSSECWGKRNASTLRHVVLFNHGGRTAKYVMTWKLAGSSKVYRSAGRIPRGQGVNDGVIIKPGQVVEWVHASSGSDIAFWRSAEWRGLPKCERRA